MSEITARRREYLQRVLDEIEEPSKADYQKVMRPLDQPLGPQQHRKAKSYDSRMWAINHSRLVLGRDIDKANRYFETACLDPRLIKRPDGMIDNPDWDFPGVMLLKTVLDFGLSDLLSEKAKTHLKAIFTDWKQPRPTVNADNDRAARWPVIHTENHDIMCLTIGLFGAILAGRDTAAHERELSKSLACRFERGWVEWHSPCYQIHYLNPLLILAGHAPSPALRKGASDLINLQMAERALLSIDGHLGGPFYRGYDRHIESDLFDAYLPVMWLAFGLSDPWLNLKEGVAFAADSFQPDPIVSALAEEAATRPLLRYKGTRYDPSEREGRMPIYYYNTPHISMGFMKALGFGHQSRFFNVMFAADPSKSLRTFMRDEQLHSAWDKRNERGEVVQYENWLISRGAMVEEGGIKPIKADKWSLYRAGKGLCAHVELPGDLHVFQVSDLDMYPDERSFLNALSVPVKAGDSVRAKTAGGEEISVELADMSLTVNGQAPEDWSDMLHECPAMRSEYGGGVVEIKTQQGNLTIDNRALAI
ncbi:MAG: hypothetical protein SVV80_05030 [Planctomycetota bacterium]|nr:hypothetical protein [Planctomycetota bacterium]